MPATKSTSRNALARFELAIADAQKLKSLFDDLRTPAEKNDLAVLKRAGHAMAMVAWETYIEARLLEAYDRRVADHSSSHAAKQLRQQLGHEIKKLHNPNSQRVQQLFTDYVAFDVTTGWVWPHHDVKRAKDDLDERIAIRGDIVHEHELSVDENGALKPHPVTTEELRKTLQFLKDLVDATEKALTKAGL